MWGGGEVAEIPFCCVTSFNKQFEDAVPPSDTVNTLTVTNEMKYMEVT